MAKLLYNCKNLNEFYGSTLPSAQVDLDLCGVEEYPGDENKLEGS